MDLEEILHGTPSWNDVAFYFQNGEFYEEAYLVKAIKKHLITKAQREWLHREDISIEDMLNGRIEGTLRQRYAHQIFTEWNTKLGFKHFGA